MTQPITITIPGSDTGGGPEMAKAAETDKARAERKMAIYDGLPKDVRGAIASAGINYPVHEAAGLCKSMSAGEVAAHIREADIYFIGVNALKRYGPNHPQAETT